MSCIHELCCFCSFCPLDCVTPILCPSQVRSIRIIQTTSIYLPSRTPLHRTSLSSPGGMSDPLAHPVERMRRVRSSLREDLTRTCHYSAAPVPLPRLSRPTTTAGAAQLLPIPPQAATAKTRASTSLTSPPAVTPSPSPCPTTIPLPKTTATAILATASSTCRAATTTTPPAKSAPPTSP